MYFHKIGIEKFIKQDLDILTKKTKNFTVKINDFTPEAEKKTNYVLGQGRRQKIFHGGLIRIEPILSTKNGRIFEIGEVWERLCENPTPMYLGFELRMQVVTTKMMCIRFSFEIAV